MKGPRIESDNAQKLEVSCNIINFLILLNIVLPYNIAFEIYKKLSSRIIISDASFAISVPLPI